MAEVTIGPAVDYDPFAARAGVDALLLASGESPRVSPDVQAQRDKVSQRLIEAEAARSGPDAATDRELADLKRAEASGDPFSRTAPNRGSKISAEMRQSKPKSVIFQNSKEAKPAVTIGEPVDFDPFAPPQAQAERGEFAKGAIGGLTGGNPKMFGAAVQGLGTIAKSDWLKAQGESLRKIGEDQLKNYQPAVGSIADVRTDSIGNALGDFFTKYLPYQAGNAVASMAPTIVSGLVGAGVGGVAAGPPGAVAGGLAGTVLSGYPMNYGDIYSDALDDKGIQQAVKDGKLTEQDVAKITALAAIPITALDSWSISKLGGAILKDAKSALYKRIFNEMVSGGLREGTTEGLQQILSEFTQNQMGGDKTLKDQAIAVVDNAIGGMAGGGLTGGAAGAVQRSGKSDTISPVTEAGASASTAPPPTSPAAVAPFSGGPPGGPETPVEPNGLPLQYPGAQTYTQAPQSLATQPPENPPEPLSPMDQARADAQVLKAGNPLDADETRLKNATLIAVYGENAAVRHVIEAPDQFSAIADAMLSAAPTVERIRGTLSQGQEKLDITPDILGAIDELAKIRESGQTVAEVMAHVVPHDISYEGQQLMAYLDENIDNPERLSAFLENYLHEVEQASGVPSQVRGRAFDIIQERQAAKQAETEQKATEQRDREFKEREFKLKEEKLKTGEIANEQRRAELALQHIANAKASGSGINPEHTTTMEHAFANAKKLKAKNADNKPGDSGVPPATPSTPQKPSGGPQAKAGHDAGPVSRPAQADNQGNARRNGEEGNRGRAAEKPNRGQAISSERAKSGQKQAIPAKVSSENGEKLATSDSLSPVIATPTVVDAAAHTAATSPKNDLPEPTDAQKEAGAYQMGHAKVGGLDISIENPEGSRRRPEWPALKSHYGYVKGVPARAPDKEHVDVFVKPGTPEDYNGPVFVVDQNKADGGFDEPKAMIGFKTLKAARSAYLHNYTKGWDRRVRGITEMTLGQFKAKLQDADAFMHPQTGERIANISPDLEITLQVEVADTGESMPMTVNARKAYREAEKRVNRLTSLLDCLS